MIENQEEGGRVRPPERLTIHHDCSQFRNGKHPSLDEWLQRRAISSEGYTARTYVVCRMGMPDNIVVGYYAIRAAMEQRGVLPSARLRRGVPDEVPLLLIGRLAIDIPHQGKGLGTALLADALCRCLSASDIAGSRGVIAHAIDDDAVRFYLRHGFVHSPLGERTMLMPIEVVRSMFD